MKEHKIKEFKPTSWAIDNKTSLYFLVIIMVVFGIMSYRSIPKEQIPEIVIPTILVNTIYPGTSPTDMENLVTRPIEKKIKAINGVKKVSSKSIQDFSMIAVEFVTSISVEDAKDKVQDAVDDANEDLPVEDDLFQTPQVAEINFSEFPIMNINLSGDYPLDRIKRYGEMIQDDIESLSEITRVDIVGALDREIQIDVDMYKMQAASATFYDIQNAVASENMTMAGGNIDMEGMTRSVRVVGEFKDIETLKNISFITSGGAVVKLTDIAEVRDDFKKQESFSRLDKKNVVTLNVVKKSGENLLNAADKIEKILDNYKENKLPNDLKVVITGDQSFYTKIVLFDLNNTIVIGFILVFLVLMFFMGVTNAFFVGLSIPLAMALSYIVLPGIGFTMNMLVMFSFIFALGIVVDDAIVVIENTHRIFKQTGKPISQSAKDAAGEVFLPILSGTLTTLAPFFPLTFWPGVVGDFMFFIPITLIIALVASLIVAYIINPVFAVSFMKHDEDHDFISRKKLIKNSVIIFAVSMLLHAAKLTFLGNLGLFFMVLYVIHNLWGQKVLLHYQHIIIPGILERYERFLRWILVKKRAYSLLAGLIILLILSFIIYGASNPKIVFFPDNEPNAIITYIKMPIGTDVNVTDSVAGKVENKIMDVLGENNPLVESMITNVAMNASEDFFESSVNSHLAKVTVNFVELKKRHGFNTNTYMDKFRLALRDIPGAEIMVSKEENGPPTGKPVNIEISGEDLEELQRTSESLQDFLVINNVRGIESLKSTFDKNKPELIVNVDRTRANREGITTGQVAMDVRTAITGTEVSKYRDGEDQYPIQLRFAKYQRENIDRLMNLKITYRDMNTGIIRQVPLSSVASINYQNSYSGIDRINLKRVITLSGNTAEGYSSSEVIIALEKALRRFSPPDGVEVKLTGEKEDQAESSAFLGKAMLFSIFLVLFILIAQFNSISKPLIILSEVLFSISGVLFGLAIFNMPFSIVFTGMGIVALAGIVVRNGILLVEFTDVSIERGLRPREAMVQGGKTRITPVILTATATILGLIPLALGFNIDFVGLFESFKPAMHFGSESSVFFAPLSWTIIFGLSFATFLTLIFIPVMYYLTYSWKLSLARHRQTRRIIKQKR